MRCRPNPMLRHWVRPGIAGTPGECCKPRLPPLRSVLLAPTACACQPKLGQARLPALELCSCAGPGQVCGMGRGGRHLPAGGDDVRCVPTPPICAVNPSKPPVLPMHAGWTAQQERDRPAMLPWPAGSATPPDRFRLAGCAGAASDTDARKIARSVVSSSLAKAAVFGHDPNWGRIACAAGCGAGAGRLLSVPPARAFHRRSAGHCWSCSGWHCRWGPSNSASLWH